MCGVPTVVYGVPTVVYGVPTAVYGVPTVVYCVPRTAVYGVPTAVYGVTAAVYEYGAPALRGVPLTSARVNTNYLKLDRDRFCGIVVAGLSCCTTRYALFVALHFFVELVCIQQVYLLQW